MTTPMFAEIADLRSYMEFNGSSTSKYTDGTLGSNLRAASAMLERRTGRWFQDRPGATWTMTTHGRASVVIPGFRTFTSVTMAGSALAANTTYWATPDSQQTGVYTGLQLRSFNTGRSDWYKAVPDWFDRNLDQARSGYGSLPNDLVIVGDGGYTAANIPEELRLATKALAGFITKRPDALLSKALATPEGNIFDYSEWPLEATAFITDWYVGSQVELI